MNDISANSRHIEILLHNIRSVYNVASIFRTSECFGVSKIWLSGYTPAPIDRFGRARSDFHKVALGTEMDMEWEQIENINELVLNKKNQKFKIIGLEQSEKSILLKNYSNINQSILLIPGTETTGLELEILNQVDEIIEIEQVGHKESLNLVVATSIALWYLK